MVGLETSKLFRGLRPEEMGVLVEAAETMSFGAHETIFQEGDPGAGLFLIGQGLVKISVLLEQNERRVLSFLGEGDFFGEMAVLDQEPRSATATAEEDSVLFFIPRQIVFDLLERSPVLAVSLVREFSLRMRDFNKQYVTEALQAERLALVGKFARSIVHDFKNPFNVIGIATEMIAREDMPQKARLESKLRIQKQLDRLSSMSNELLEFTRSAKEAFFLAPTPYPQFVMPLLEEIQAEVRSKNVTLVMEGEPPEAVIPMDPKRLSHVFYNLIHNAVDAMMPEGGQVFIRFQLLEDRLVTEVEDTGKGIAPEIALRLFDAFATFGKAQGTGLGLSICKKIISDHQGQIEALRLPGRGAIFRFALPLNSSIRLPSGGGGHHA